MPLLHKVFTVPPLVSGYAAYQNNLFITRGEAAELLKLAGESKSAHLRLLGDLVKHIIALPEAVVKGHPDGFRAPIRFSYIIWPLICDNPCFVAANPEAQARLFGELAQDSYSDLARAVPAGSQLAQDMQRLCPMAYDYLKATRTQVFPKQLLPVFQSLHDLAVLISKAERKWTTPSSPTTPLTLAQLEGGGAAMALEAQAIRAAEAFVPTSLEEDCARGEWTSPNFRFQRSALIEQRETALNSRKESKGLSGCNKAFGDLKSHLPGMGVWACPHGYVVALKFLRTPESPAMLTDFLYDRCRPDFIPRIFCYDHACGADQHSRARLGPLISGLTWTVDRLHRRNHTKCSTCYNMDVYGNYNPATWGFNR